MGLKALEISQFERRLIARIVAEATDQGVSRRALGSRAGLSVGRALRILAGEASCSMTAFEALCDALGLEMWRVVQEVETGASAPGGSLAVVPGHGADIESVDTLSSAQENSEGFIEFSFRLQISNLKQLEQIISALYAISQVRKVQRQ